MLLDLPRLADTEARELLDAGLIHRDGYHFRWKSHPAIWRVDVKAIFIYAGLYVPVGLTGTEWVVSFQNYHMRAHGREAMYFMARNHYSFLVRPHGDFYRYVHERLRLKAVDLAPYVIALPAFV